MSIGSDGKEAAAHPESSVPPEAIRPFWSEVVVFSLAMIGAVGLVVALYGLSADGRLGPLRIFLMMYDWMVLALLQPVLRGLARPHLRRAMGLPRDPLPVWFKLFGVAYAPDHARDVSPAWHIEDDRLHAPVFGHFVGSAFAVVTAICALALIVPEGGLVLQSYFHWLFSPFGLIIGPVSVIMIVVWAGQAHSRSTLPPRGQPRYFWNLPFRYD